MLADWQAWGKGVGEKIVGSALVLPSMIRQTATLDGIKVVIISAEATIPARVRKLADAVVAKSIEVAALLSMVKSLLPPGAAAT